MDEDVVLTKITRLLEQGCTMLATHHDCGAPLFRCKGEIVCPICSFPEPPGASFEPVSSPSASSQSLSLSPSSPPSPPLSSLSPPVSQPPSAPSFSLSSCRLGGEESHHFGRAGDEEWRALAGRLRSSLLRRLHGLAEAIESEQDLDRLKRELECVEGLLLALRSLQE